MIQEGIPGARAASSYGTRLSFKELCPRLKQLAVPFYFLASKFPKRFRSFRVGKRKWHAAPFLEPPSVTGVPREDAVALRLADGVRAVAPGGLPGSPCSNAHPLAPRSGTTRSHPGAMACRPRPSRGLLVTCWGRPGDTGAEKRLPVSGGKASIFVTGRAVLSSPGGTDHTDAGAGAQHRAERRPRGQAGARPRGQRRRLTRESRAGGSRFRRRSGPPR